MKPVLLTGFRPTGDLHLGHFLSLIEPLIRYKNDYQIFVMVADLHAQTSLRKSKVNYSCFLDELKYNTMMALQIITDFVDPADLVMFRQSDLREYHLNLFYKLLMISRHNQTFGNPIFIDAMRTELFAEIDQMKLDDEVRRVLRWYIGEHPEILYGNIHDGHASELAMHFDMQPFYNNMTQEKVIQIVKHLNTRIGVMGFASYPILMAADIILYQPEYTLVGKDQNPHIQITNDLVKIMNKTFDFGLRPTKGLIAAECTLKGCDGNKMSKTLGNYLPIRYLLGDNISKCKPYFMKMKTFSRRKEDPGDPNACPVFEYWKLFECGVIDNLCRLAKLTCLECKARLAEVAHGYVKGKLRSNVCFVNTDELLKEGAEVARKRIIESELIKKQFI